MNENSGFPPWVVFDADTKAEFVLPQLLRYYVAKVGEEWFICDRFTDTKVPGTTARSRADCIRRFYNLQNRQIPDGWDIPPAPKQAEHGGIG